MNFKFRCKVTRPDGSHAVNVNKNVTLGWKCAVGAVAAITAIVVLTNR